MSYRALFIAYITIVNREINRFIRIWPQTFIPNIITTTLYYIIFGKVIGSKLGNIEGVRYIDFMIPGLVMMTIISNSYSNTVSSFFSSKFQRSIEELVVSPTPYFIIIFGYVTGGVVRGLISGFLVLAISLFFRENHHIYSLTILTIISVIAGIIFSLIGLINGLYAKKFDDVSWIPSFVIIPLSYLGGIFYSIKQLPDFWYKISLMNPIFYCVELTRYGFLGISSFELITLFPISVVIMLILYRITIYIMRRKLQS